MTLRNRLEATIGHYVGWDVVDCPTCGPVPEHEADEHHNCAHDCTGGRPLTPREHARQKTSNR